MSFAVIPAIYPAKINTMNGKLTPLVVPDFMFLANDIGHEHPKQINITDSKISHISSSPFGLNFTIAFLYCLIYNKHKINIKFIIG